MNQSAALIFSNMFTRPPLTSERIMDMWLWRWPRWFHTNRGNGREERVWRKDGAFMVIKLKGPPEPFPWLVPQVHHPARRCYVRMHGDQPGNRKYGHGKQLDCSGSRMMAQYQPMNTVPSQKVGLEARFLLSLPRIREEVLVSGQLGNQSFTIKCVSKADMDRGSAV